MSALGQKQTLGKVRLMSALPPKADMVERLGMSALCQKRTFDRLFDHLVGAGESGLEPLFVERQRRAETQASSASLSVLVMTADPKRAFAILVSTLGHKIKVLIIDVHHVDAAGICRICMKDVPVGVFVEDAHTLAL